MKKTLVLLISLLYFPLAIFAANTNSSLSPQEAFVVKLIKAVSVKDLAAIKTMAAPKAILQLEEAFSPDNHFSEAPASYEGFVFEYLLKFQGFTRDDQALRRFAVYHVDAESRASRDADSSVTDSENYFDIGSFTIEEQAGKWVLIAYEN